MRVEPPAGDFGRLVAGAEKLRVVRTVRAVLGRKGSKRRKVPSMRDSGDKLLLTPPWIGSAKADQERHSPQPCRGHHHFQALQLARRRADRIEAEAQARQAEADRRARILAVARQEALARLQATADLSLRAQAAEFSNCLGAQDGGLQTTNSAQGPPTPDCPPDPPLKRIKVN